MDRTLLQRCSALALVLKPDHFFSHVTAARLHGLPLPRRLEQDTTIHVSSFAPTRAPRRAGVVGHRAERSRVKVGRIAQLPLALPAYAWCQLASILSLDELIAAGDRLAGMSRPLATSSEIEEAVIAFGQGHGSKRLADAFNLIRPNVASPMETALRLELMRAGLPEPELNIPIFDSTGHRIAIGDLVYTGFRVLVEYDGEQHRLDDYQYSRDVVRHNDLIAAGWITIRVNKQMHLREASARTREALRSRGWPDSD
ncbi:hypothetical protein G3T36_13990 [Diaminobutyricibacter tongyongensis]|uniref:DUF559 domain-containing protein n=1 Tax=Leifsonia tongyongensis TaxID=1268043 RepID=A0A6L9Y007_9MICO|nr:hypothetical protein [Diaminobutyricibacter tongyongensis]NEN06971.1 hypothetical protein [Diaminobutyricibacter tongyongensis]